MLLPAACRGDRPGGAPNVGLMVPSATCSPICWGPTALAEPPWVAISVTVAAVLLLTARDKLHGFARRLELGEIVTAGKFLILTGLVLPLLPNEPVTRLPILPHSGMARRGRSASFPMRVICCSAMLHPPVAGFGWGCSAALFLHRHDRGAARRARAEPATLLQPQTGHHSRDRGHVSSAACHHPGVRPAACTRAPPAAIARSSRQLGFAIAGFWYSMAAHAPTVRPSRPTHARPIHWSSARPRSSRPCSW